MLPDRCRKGFLTGFVLCHPLIIDPEVDRVGVLVKLTKIQRGIAVFAEGNDLIITVIDVVGHGLRGLRLRVRSIGRCIGRIAIVIKDNACTGRVRCIRRVRCIIRVRAVLDLVDYDTCILGAFVRGISLVLLACILRCAVLCRLLGILCRCRVSITFSSACLTGFSCGIPLVGSPGILSGTAVITCRRCLFRSLCLDR